MQNLLRDAFPSNSTIDVRLLSQATLRSKLYVIFLTPRSGRFNDGWIYTEEVALGCRPPRLRGTTDINAYISSIIDEGPGIAGVQLSVFQALMVSELFNGQFDPNIFSGFFYLRRRDLLSQGISLYRSVASGRFHSYQNKPEEIRAFNEVHYDQNAIVNWITFLLDCESRFSEMFQSCSIRPQPLFYEDLQEDPISILNLISKTLGVEIGSTIPSTSISVLRDQTSYQWKDNLCKTIPEALQNLLEERRQRLD
jgi:hypothetical protein